MTGAWNMLKNIVAIGVMSLMFTGVYWFMDEPPKRKCPYGSDYAVSDFGVYCIGMIRPRLP